MNKYSRKSNQLRVADAFSGAAATYNAAAVLQREIGRRLIERLNFVRVNVKTAMDLGASTGYFTQELNQCYPGARVIAVDIAEGMLRYMQQNMSKTASHPPPSAPPPARGGGNLLGIYLVCANAQYLPFASKTVDLVFSNLMLQWCSDTLEVFREVQRVLKPGGLFMFSTLGPDTLYELRQSWAQVDDYQHVNTFIDMHDVGDALLASGLLDPVVDMEYMTVTYNKVNGLLKDLRDLGASQVVVDQRMPGLLGRKHYQAFVQAYENFRDVEGVLPATYEVIYGHAWGAPEINEENLMMKEARVFIRDIGRRSF